MSEEILLTAGLLNELARLRTERDAAVASRDQALRSVEAAHQKIDMLRADDATLRDGIHRYVKATPEERGPLYHRLFVLTIADSPGAALLAELDAARALRIQVVEWIDDPELSAALAAYDAAVNARDE